MQAGEMRAETAEATGSGGCGENATPRDPGSAVAAKGCDTHGP